MNSVEDINITIKRTLDHSEYPSLKTSKVIIKHNGVKHIFIGGECNIKIRHFVVNDSAMRK